MILLNVIQLGDSQELMMIAVLVVEELTKLTHGLITIEHLSRMELILKLPTSKEFSSSTLMSFIHALKMYK